MPNYDGRAIHNFTKVTHTTYNGSTDASKVKLPSPYVVCIIGASRGIGEAIAYAYARAGASGIAISARSTSAIEDVAKKISEINSTIEVHIVTCDTSSDSSVKNLTDEVNNEFGRLDVLISNAGFSGPMLTDITEASPADVQQAFDVNCIGTYLAAHHFIPLLMASPNGAKAFIAISSMAVLVTDGPIASVGYCISKFAQLRVVEFIATQYGKDGLLAVAIHPGGVKTELAKAAPEGFDKLLVDEPNLCGNFCVWLTKDAHIKEKQWLSGRFVSAKWDVDELMIRRDEIVNGDMLKMRMVVP